MSLEKVVRVNSMYLESKYTNQSAGKHDHVDLYFLHYFHFDSSAGLI